MLMYNRLLSCLLQAWYLPVVTFRDTPRKLTALKFFFASYTKTKISIKYFIKYFLILSAWGSLIYSRQANSSSWYKLCYVFLYFWSKMWRIYEPTSSHDSVPSILPIVTSQYGSPFFFTQISVLLYSRDFLECIMVLMS